MEEPSLHHFSVINVSVCSVLFSLCSLCPLWLILVEDPNVRPQRTQRARRKGALCISRFSPARISSAADCPLAGFAAGRQAEKKGPRGPVTTRGVSGVRFFESGKPLRRISRSAP